MNLEAAPQHHSRTVKQHACVVRLDPKQLADVFGIELEHLAQHKYTRRVCWQTRETELHPPHEIKLMRHEGWVGPFVRLRSPHAAFIEHRLEITGTKLGFEVG